MTLESKFNFGDRVEDVVTGNTGIVVAIDFWMNGCQRVGVQPRAKKDADKYPDMSWIDSHQLKTIEAGAVKIAAHKPTEGPMPSCSNNAGLK